MDEFAVRRSHRYAPVILEPARKRVLWVGEGRGREDVRPFFELLGPERRARLHAVAMDMTAAYEEEVRAQCPQARPSHRTALRAGTVRRCTTVVCIDARIGRMRQ
ncbi:MAG TPA: transposase [bacterium]|nr:transposase [bacterium]